MTISDQLNKVKRIKADIKQAIIDKGVTVSEQESFSTYPSKISLIPTGVEPVLEDITVTVNGTYSAGSGYDGLGNVEVNVEGHDEPILQDKTLEVDATTATETVIEPDSGYDGLSSVTVDLSYIDDRLDTVLGSGTVPINYGPNREISAQGVYQMPSQSFSFSLPNNVVSLDARTLTEAFYGCTGLTSVDLSSLTTVSGDRAMYNAFNGCTGLTSVDLSSLITLSGESAMYSAFYGCSNLTSVDLSSLVSITAYGAMYLAFRYCESLTSVDLSSLTTLSSVNAMNSVFDGTALSNIDLSSLTTVSGSGALRCAFYNCESLTSVDLSSLTTLSGSGALIYAFQGCTSLTSLSITLEARAQRLKTSGYSSRISLRIGLKIFI